MLMPNQICLLVKSGGNDVYGQPKPGIRSRERCSIVKMPSLDVKSSIRADSSASRGNAHELQTNGVVLLTASTSALMHDLLIIRGQTVKITGVHPRYSAAGNLDHFEMTVSIWSQ